MTCALMEDKGADSFSVTEASIEAVKESDVYVGIFGTRIFSNHYLRVSRSNKTKKAVPNICKEGSREITGLINLLKRF